MLQLITKPQKTNRPVPAWHKGDLGAEYFGTTFIVQSQDLLTCGLKFDTILDDYQIIGLMPMNVTTLPNGSYQYECGCDMFNKIEVQQQAIDVTGNNIQFISRPVKIGDDFVISHTKKLYVGTKIYGPCVIENLVVRDLCLLDGEYIGVGEYHYRCECTHFEEAPPNKEEVKLERAWELDYSNADKYDAIIMHSPNHGSLVVTSETDKFFYTFLLSIRK